MSVVHDSIDSETGLLKPEVSGYMESWGNAILGEHYWNKDNSQEGKVRLIAIENNLPRSEPSDGQIIVTMNHHGRLGRFGMHTFAYGYRSWNSRFELANAEEYGICYNCFNTCRAIGTTECVFYKERGD